MNDPAKVIAEAREKNPHERLHPAWAGTEHVAWEDGFDAAVAALAAAGFPVGESRDVDAIIERLTLCSWGPLYDPEGGGEPVNAVLLADALAAVREAAQPAPHEPPSVPWGRVRELLLSGEAVEAAVSAIEIVDGRICKETQGACCCAGERKQALAALAAAVDHAEKEERDG